VISVRYSNHSSQRFKGTSFPAGFALAIRFAGPGVNQHIDETTENLSNQMFFAALALAFGLLHLILFLFSPGSKTHLYFSIFIFFWAANTFFDYQNFLAADYNHELFYLRIHRTVVIFVNIFQLRFIYSLFRAKEMELERRLLEAEDARKSKELEEARLLQLSMLPECAGEIPGLDICFHMETATEVGGDYYDYHLADDGTLTVVFGDATGLYPYFCDTLKDTRRITH